MPSTQRALDLGDERAQRILCLEQRIRTHQEAGRPDVARCLNQVLQREIAERDRERRAS